MIELRDCRKQRHHGFSVIEIVVTIVIISALAVFAMGRVGTQASFGARGYYDELVSATRFAQRYAVASGCTVRITITVNAYSLTTQGGSCGAGTPVQSPTGNTFSGTAPGGVTVTGGSGNYHFNAWGDTVDAGGNTGPGGSVQVQGGGSTYSFTITADSGFIQ